VRPGAGRRVVRQAPTATGDVASAQGTGSILRQSMSTDANAPGARPTLGHLKGLDGIRAFAVLSIIAFHTGLNSVPGGFYGVDAFFVLSGFLITSLLVKEWGGTGTIRLRRFWAGRARRLLPALFLMVTVVGLVMAIWPQVLSSQNIVGDAFSTVFYYSNWYSIHNGVTYFDLTSQPSPFLHTWSLAIEEQFYLVWPLVVLAVLRVGRARARAAQSSTEQVPVLGGGRLLLRAAPVGTASGAGSSPGEASRRHRLHALFAVACLGSLASAVAMAFLAPDGYTTRAYYGTDCRAQALLVGAAISIGLTLWHEGAQRPWFRSAAAVLGVLGAAGTAALWCMTSETTTFAFSGGFMVASLAAGAVVLGCVAAPRSLVVRLLELPPLPQWGRISYGVYLWYWPVLLVMTPERLHWGVYPLFLARVGLAVAIAALSYDLVEMPIRRGVLKTWRSWVALPIGAAVAVPAGASGLQGSTLSAPPTTTATTSGGTVAGQSTTTVPYPSSLSPAPPGVPRSPHPVKVLVVGDSIAGTLAIGLDLVARNANVQIVDEGLPGCSVSNTEQIKVLFYVAASGPPCDSTNPDAIFATWRHWVDTYNPDVVVYAARSQTFDQQVGSTWEHIGQASFDSYLTARFRRAVEVLGARGAAVVFMTSPYYDSGTQSSGTPWPEDAPDRVNLDNATIRRVATSSSAPGGVYVFNLNGVVSPGGRYSAAVDGVNVRCSDGVHFTTSGGIYVGLRLVPDLVALGQAHVSASPGGAWAGPLPPSTPSWYAKLPC
jgi:peptidoglycan/LPS O-acetylase OafA/YrhL